MTDQGPKKEKQGKKITNPTKTSGGVGEKHRAMGGEDKKKKKKQPVPGGKKGKTMSHIKWGELELFQGSGKKKKKTMPGNNKRKYGKVTTWGANWLANEKTFHKDTPWKVRKNDTTNPLGGFGGFGNRFFKNFPKTTRQTCLKKEMRSMSPAGVPSWPPHNTSGAKKIMRGLWVKKKGREQELLTCKKNGKKNNSQPGGGGFAQAGVKTSQKNLKG